MTTYSFIVDPGNEQSEWTTNYTSLSAWEAAQDIASDGYNSGDIVIADCRRSTSAKDTTFCYIFGWKTGVIPKIIVHEDYRHEGKWADQRGDGNYIYVLRHTGIGNDAALTLYMDDAEVNGLCIDLANSPPNGTQGIICGSNKINLSIANNIVKKTSMGTSLGISIEGITSYIRKCYNNIVIGFSIGILGNFGTVYVYNNTVFNCSTGIVQSFGSSTVKNNVVLNCSTCYSLGATGTKDKNVSSDATAPGTTVAINKTSYGDYFINYSNDDFHLKGFGSSLFGISGEDLSASFAIDIDGDTRSAWDVGADEYVPSGGSSLVSTIMQQHNQLNGGAIHEAY